MSDARFASAFADAAEEYERGRPGYPPAAIEALAGELELGPAATVVDLAAGTGKLTRELARRFERVVAIEPLAEMREQLVRSVPEAEALEGTAERMPLADESADAVFVAQAFHWFDGDRALREIARVLRRRGGLALIWNTTPWERRETPWFALVDDLLERSRADLSTLHRNASGRWREAFAEQQHFAPLTEATFDNTHTVAKQDLIDALASRSYVAVLEPDERAEVLEGVAALLERDDAPVEGGRLVVPMRTECHWTRLTEAS